MKQSIRIFAVVAMAAGALGFAALPSGAGSLRINTVTVEKEVDGPVPTGTTFTVELVCESQVVPHAEAPTPEIITFNASGTATSENTFPVGEGMVCTATETDDGGATTVAYACDVTDGKPAVCSDDNQVSFDSLEDDATITVTNTFTAAPTTTTTTTTTTVPLAPVTPAAQAVKAAPAFTG
jgi:hypothetical protein